jgi:hypothetical protein
MAHTGWGRSSVGKALASQAPGPGFVPSIYNYLGTYYLSRYRIKLLVTKKKKLTVKQLHVASHPVSESFFFFCGTGA